jgi:hypothetical protein
MQVLIKCAKCSSDFPREVKSINRNNKLGMLHFCSRACMIASRVTAVEFNCDNCGKPHTTPRNQFDKSKSGLHFCSKSCRTKMLNIGNRYNFGNGSGSYRKLAFDNYPVECAVTGCGYAVESILEVHHMDKNRSNNTLSNLKILCPTHHAEYHKNLR